MAFHIRSKNSNNKSSMFPRKLRLLIVGSFLLILLGITGFLLIKAQFTKADTTADWRFDEGDGATANDAGTGSNSGTVTNAVWKTDEFCVFGKCLYFDGAGDYVSRTDDAEFDVDTGESATFMLWFRHPDISTNPDYIVAKHDGTEAGYKIYMNADGTITCGVDGDSTWSPTDSTSSTLSYDDNKWHHLACVKSTTTSLKLYIDGQAVGTEDTSVTASVANNDTFYLGIDGNGSSNGWEGFIDEFKIFKTAKTADQIKLDYVGRATSDGAAVQFGLDGQTSQYLSDSLIGYWAMDGTSGNMTDSSGNGYTLTDVNTVAYVPGKFGNNGDFESGSSEYQYIADNATISITGSLAITAWIRPESTTAATQFDIAGKFDGTNESYLLAQYGDELRLYIDSSSNYIETSATNLATSTFYHITASYNAPAQTAKIYVNGIEQATTTTGTIPSSIGDDAGRFQIGAEDSTGGAANFYDGYIDDVRLYSRRLSASEALKIYNWGPSPLAYWTFDEASGTSINDRAGGTYTGTINGGAGRTPGKYGNAISTDGSNDNVDVGGDVLDATGSFTVSMWIKRTSVSSDAMIISKKLGANAGNSGWMIYQWGSGSGGNTCLYVADGSNQYENCTDDNSTNTLNTWVHLAASYDVINGDVTSTIYLNGVDSEAILSDYENGDPTTGVGAIVEANVNNTNNLCIGSIATNAANCTSAGSLFFPGAIDDLKFYNYVRTPEQIVEDMNAGHPTVGTPVAGPVAHWRFDDAAGTTAQDTTLNNNDLTLSSASWTLDGKYDEAWDGTGAIWLSRSDDNDFDFAAADDFTITGWFRHDTASAAEVILNKEESVGADGGYRVQMESDGDITFGIDDDNTSFPEDSVTSTAATYDDNSWHHFVAVKTGTTSLRLYIDGREVGTADTSISSTGTLVNDDTLYVGDSNGSNGTDEFNGELDEMKIYRAALSATDVLAEYNQGKTQVLGALGTDSSGNASWAARRGFCPPGNAERNCGGSNNPAPVGYWTYDENTGTTANDLSGNNLGGTLSGNATYRVGKYGSAVFVDGTSDYVYTADSATLDLTDTDAVTVSVWFKPTSDAQSGDIVSKKTSSNTTDAGYKLTWFNSSEGGNTCFYVSDGSSNGSDQYEVCTPDTATQTLNQWYHIVGVFDNSGVAGSAIYLNGIEYNNFETCNGCSSSTAISDIGSPDNAATLCAGSGGSSTPGSCLTTNEVAGFIDEVKVYKYARSKAQILWDYNRGAPIAYWKLDEGSGTTGNDSSGNSNSLTLNSASWNTTTAKYTNAWNGTGGDLRMSKTTDSDLEFSDTDDFGISLWFKSDATSNPAAAEYLVADGGPAGSAGYAIYLNTDGTLCFGIDDDTTWTPGPDTSSCGTADVYDNTWHHVMAVRDHNINDQILLYIDGALVDSDTDTTTATLDSSPTFYVGDIDSDNAGSGEEFAGDIDEVKVFRYNPSSQQAKLDFNQGSAIRFAPLTGTP